jgi:hypothetical protein
VVWCINLTSDCQLGSLGTLSSKATFCLFIPGRILCHFLRELCNYVPEVNTADFLQLYKCLHSKSLEPFGWAASSCCILRLHFCFCFNKPHSVILTVHLPLHFFFNESENLLPSSGDIRVCHVTETGRQYWKDLWQKNKDDIKYIFNVS